MNIQDIQRELNINYNEAALFKERAEKLGLFNVICCFNDKLDIITQLDNTATHLLFKDKSKKREWSNKVRSVIEEHKLELWNNR